MPLSSVPIIDISNNQLGLTAGDNVYVDLSTFKYGSGSVYFSGSANSDIKFNNSPKFGFSTGDFSVEMWIKPQPSPLTYTSLFSIGSDSDGILMRLNSLSGDNLYIAGTNYNWGAGRIKNNTWSHVVLSRELSVVKVFVDGTLTLSSFNGANLGNVKDLIIGNSKSNPTEYYKGHMDDIHIVNGATFYPINNLSANKFGKDVVWYTNGTKSTPAQAALQSGLSGIGNGIIGDFGSFYSAGSAASPEQAVQYINYSGFGDGQIGLSGTLYSNGNLYTGQGTSNLGVSGTWYTDGVQSSPAQAASQSNFTGKGNGVIGDNNLWYTNGVTSTPTEAALQANYTGLGDGLVGEFNTYYLNGVVATPAEAAQITNFSGLGDGVKGENNVWYYKGQQSTPEQAVAQDLAYQTSFTGKGDGTIGILNEWYTNGHESNADQAADQRAYEANLTGYGNGTIGRNGIYYTNGTPPDPDQLASILNLTGIGNNVVGYSGVWYTNGNRSTPSQAATQSNFTGQGDGTIGVSGTWYTNGSQSSPAQAAAQSNFTGQGDGTIGVNGKWYTGGGLSTPAEAAVQSNFTGQGDGVIGVSGTWYTNGSLSNSAQIAAQSTNFTGLGNGTKGLDNVWYTNGHESTPNEIAGQTNFTGLGNGTIGTNDVWYTNGQPSTPAQIAGQTNFTGLGDGTIGASGVWYTNGSVSSAAQAAAQSSGYTGLGDGTMGESGKWYTNGAYSTPSESAAQANLTGLGNGTIGVSGTWYTSGSVSTPTEAAAQANLTGLGDGTIGVSGTWYTSGTQSTPTQAATQSSFTGLGNGTIGVSGTWYTSGSISTASQAATQSSFTGKGNGTIGVNGTWYTNGSVSTIEQAGDQEAAAQSLTGKGNGVIGVNNIWYTNGSRSTTTQAANQRAAEANLTGLGNGTTGENRVWYTSGAKSNQTQINSQAAAYAASIEYTGLGNGVEGISGLYYILGTVSIPRVVALQNNYTGKGDGTIGELGVYYQSGKPGTGYVNASNGYTFEIGDQDYAYCDGVYAYGYYTEMDDGYGGTYWEYHYPSPWDNNGITYYSAQFASFLLSINRGSGPIYFTNNIGKSIGYIDLFTDPFWSAPPNGTDPYGNPIPATILQDPNFDPNTCQINGYNNITDIFNTYAWGGTITYGYINGTYIGTQTEVGYGSEMYYSATDSSNYYFENNGNIFPYDLSNFIGSFNNLYGQNDILFDFNHQPYTGYNSISSGPISHLLNLPNTWQYTFYYLSPLDQSEVTVYFTSFSQLTSNTEAYQYLINGNAYIRQDYYTTSVYLNDVINNIIQEHITDVFNNSVYNPGNGQPPVCTGLGSINTWYTNGYQSILSEVNAQRTKFNGKGNGSTGLSGVYYLNGVETSPLSVLPYLTHYTGVGDGLSGVAGAWYYDGNLFTGIGNGTVGVSGRYYENGFYGSPENGASFVNYTGLGNGIIGLSSTFYTNGSPSTGNTLLTQQGAYAYQINYTGWGNGVSGYNLYFYSNGVATVASVSAVNLQYTGIGNSITGVSGYHYHYGEVDNLDSDTAYRHYVYYTLQQKNGLLDLTNEQLLAWNWRDYSYSLFLGTGLIGEYNKYYLISPMIIDLNDNDIIITPSDWPSLSTQGISSLTVSNSAYVIPGTYPRSIPFSLYRETTRVYTPAQAAIENNLTGLGDGVIGEYGVWYTNGSASNPDQLVLQSNYTGQGNGLTGNLGYYYYNGVAITSSTPVGNQFVVNEGPFNLSGYSLRYSSRSYTTLESYDNAIPATGEFTIEFFVKSYSWNGSYFPYGVAIMNNSSESMYIQVNPTTNKYAQLVFWVNGDTYNTTSYLSTGLWYHIAITRTSDSKFNFYINGVLDSSSSTNNTIIPDNKIWKIGSIGTDAIEGHISNIRFTKSCLYDSNFTPPTEMLSAVQNTSIVYTYPYNGMYQSTIYSGNTADAGATNGPLSSATFHQPFGITYDSSGNIYISDEIQHVIRKITKSTGEVSIFAGSPGAAGSTNATGSAARFSYPKGLCTDTSDNIYVADGGNNKIRKITPSGVVTTFIGPADNVAGYANTMTPRFNNPCGVTYDETTGIMYIADRNNHVIRKININGSGLGTLAGLNTPGYANQTGVNARFNYPIGVATDLSSNVYVVDQYNHAIRKITTSGVTTTFVGSSAGVSGEVDAMGLSARLVYPSSIYIDSRDNMYVGTTTGVKQISRGGLVTTIANKEFLTGTITNGNALSSVFDVVYGIVGQDNEILATGHDSHVIRKITRG